MGFPLITDGNSTPCPNCGSTTLHQETVQIYFRQEDAEQGIAVTVNGWAHHNPTSGGDVVGFNTDQKENPSPRRDGVAIQFWCEACPAKPVLHVVQHKGDTIIEWGSRD